MYRGNYKKDIRRSNSPKDEYAIVLDVVVSPMSYKNEKIIQAIGTKTYSLLELVPKPGVEITVGEKVYIGPDKRDKIQLIKRALWPDKLSNDAKSELIYAIEDIVEEREEDYVNFINNAGPITIRKHSLELIPSVGKKHLQDLIQEREKKPFESFEDISKRCPFLSNPVKVFSQRILDEIEGKTEHKFFIIRN
jgi:putative nucleotide binding protein